ncbi:uncharacterized protein [Typha latifolia]|uniref:uncharacterized protein n=1 Tax=Typha latifolia TaxID=4733 RepID=UPI003C2BCBC4
MDKSPDSHSGRRRRGATNLASCAVAGVFLLLVAAASAVAVFVLFRPRDPTIEVASVHFPSFSASNGTAAFTFSQYTAVRNPNRAAFSHYDSWLQLVYGGNQVGFMFIPAGQIDGGRTQYMAASFAVDHFPLAAVPPTAPSAAAAAVEVESKMRVKGRVKVLKFFTHNVEATAGCRVAVSPTDGSVLGLRC